MDNGRIILQYRETWTGRYRYEDDDGRVIATGKVPIDRVLYREGQYLPVPSWTGNDKTDRAILLERVMFDLGTTVEVATGVESFTDFGDEDSDS